MSTSIRTRARNPRGSGAQLRDEIVAGARALLVESGSESAVTLRAVARQVGIAAPSIYAHFDSPEQIVHAVVVETYELLQERIERARAGAATPRDRLLAGSRAYLTFGAEQPALYGLLFSRRRTTRTGSAAGRASVADIDGAGAFRLLLDGVRECIEDGSSTADSPVDVAVQIWVALHGLVQLRANEPEFPWPDADRTETELISHLARLTGTVPPTRARKASRAPRAAR